MRHFQSMFYFYTNWKIYLGRVKSLHWCIFKGMEYYLMQQVVGSSFQKLHSCGDVRRLFFRKNKKRVSYRTVVFLISNISIKQNIFAMTKPFFCVAKAHYSTNTIRSITMALEKKNIQTCRLF